MLGLKVSPLLSQVLSGGRGKAGGIKFSSEPEDVITKAQELLATEIKGSKVNTVLIEEKVNIEKEIYIAITIDGAKRQPVFLASVVGGMDIEQVPEEQLIKRLLDVTIWPTALCCTRNYSSTRFERPSSPTNLRYFAQTIPVFPQARC